MIIAAAIVLVTQTETWSNLYRPLPGDIDADWKYAYAQAPLKRSPLYRKITEEVEKAVADKRDLREMADESVAKFNRSPRMDHLARATLLNYYNYVATSRLDFLPAGWYDQSWQKMQMRRESGQVSEVDFSPNDYYLSRIRFLSDSCSGPWLPIRQAGYRLYKYEPTDFRVAGRLARILVLSSKFERGVSLNIVERVKREQANRWQTWSLAATVYYWTGFYTNQKSYLEKSLTSVNRALSFSDIPEQNLAGLKRRKTQVESDLRNGFPSANGKPPKS
jgi:hypothetical protein